MIQKLAFACLRDLDGHEYGRRPPSQLTVGDKLNEVIEAVNTRPVIADCGCWTQGDCWHRCEQHTEKNPAPVSPRTLAEMFNRAQAEVTAARSNKPSGFRPLHIEDGQVQETCTCRTYNGQWLTTYNCPQHGSVSVPEAEPQEQELPEADLEEHSRISADFARAIADVELAAIRAYVVQDTPSLHHQKSQQLDTARRVLFAAAHREYAQPQPRHFKDGEDATLGVGSPTVSQAYGVSGGIQAPIMREITTTVHVEKRGDKYYWPGTNREFPGVNSGL